MKITTSVSLTDEQVFTACVWTSGSIFCWPYWQILLDLIDLIITIYKKYKKCVTLCISISHQERIESLILHVCGYFSH